MTAVDVGIDESIWSVYGSIHMTFRRKMNDRVQSMVLNELSDEVIIADIAMHEGDLRNAIQISAVPRIGQGIQDHHHIVRIQHSPVVNEIGADESRSSSHQQFSHDVSPHEASRVDSHAN